MSARQLDKARQVRSEWAYELMAISCRTGRGFPGTAGNAKRFTNRAERRAGRLEASEGLQDYYDELEPEAPVEPPESPEERFVEPPKQSIEEVEEIISGNYAFFLDANHPLDITYCPGELAEKCYNAMIVQGCSPFVTNRETVWVFCTDGVSNVDGGERWELHKAPDWWFAEES